MTRWIVLGLGFALIVAAQGIASRAADPNFAPAPAAPLRPAGVGEAIADLRGRLP